MTAPTVDVKATYPPDTGMRVGIVRISGGVATVEVSGKTINAQFLTPGILADGSPVVLFRGDGSWVALGGMQAEPQLVETGVEGITFVLQTTFSVGVSFTRPFVVAPNVHLNINSNAAATVSWFAKATSISETGFAIVVNGPVASWTNVAVQWTAVAA